MFVVERIKRGDLDEVRSLIADLGHLVDRDDIGALEAMGISTATSSIVDALIGVGELDLAREAVAVQARGIVHAPSHDFLHAGSVGRLIAAYLDAGRREDAREAHTTLVVRAQVPIQVDAGLAARLAD